MIVFQDALYVPNYSLSSCCKNTPAERNNSSVNIKILVSVLHIRQNQCLNKTVSSVEIPAMFLADQILRIEVIA